ncbi:MAG TPA: hypothetical protein VK284_01525 [Streptosporangiaceae bacterium]|nr:hypothetical protein [Streptosporangiaceae bacterium]
MFTTKTSCDVEGTMSYFAPDLVTYTDATLGWDFDSFRALRNIFEQYMPGWKPPARCYATAILSNDVSALVHMVDTPELFGGELRILAAVDFCDGKIVRWVDYWDAVPYDEQLYAQFRTPGARFPRDLKDAEVPTQAPPELVAAATALQQAFAAGDASAAADLLHTDVVLTDMSLRAQLIGRIETARYLSRVLASVPYGQSSSLRHVIGGTASGGFEWTAGPGHRGLVGITALELDAGQLITKVTSVYDSRQLSPARRAAPCSTTACTPRRSSCSRQRSGHEDRTGASPTFGRPATGHPASGQRSPEPAARARNRPANPRQTAPAGGWSHSSPPGTGVPG